MRMPLLITFAALCLTAFPSPAPAQDAGKIVDQYVKAEGGSKALSKVRSMKVEGTFTSATDGRAGTYTLDTKLPNCYYSELVVGNRSFIEAYNGRSAWRQDAAGHTGTLVGAEGLQLEAASQYYNMRLLDPKKNKIALTFVGHSQVQEKDALHVELSTATGVKRQVFFDPRTHLIVKESATMCGIDEDFLYDDYRVIEGIKVPYKIELRRGIDTYTISITRVSINETLDERIFDFPKESQSKLPDLKALFKEIDDNQKIIDKLKENYAGTRTEEKMEFDPNGQVKNHEVNEYTFFYLNGNEISTLVKKNGKPLSSDEQRKENEKTQKQIQATQERATKKETKERRAKEQGKEGQDEDDIGIEVFLRACRFVNPRRERFRGHDVLVFDFEPNPDFKPHKLQENFVQKLAGVVWIDEHAHDVARLQAYFVGDIKLGGGLLVNLQKGASFVFEQDFVNDEVWLPTYQEAHLGIRVFLVKGIKVNQVARYSDYKKFNVETLSTVSKPKNADAQTEMPADSR
jgi:hypothetical protein